jgi:hypothetical protein
MGKDKGWNEERVREALKNRPQAEIDYKNVSVFIESVVDFEER